MKIVNSIVYTMGELIEVDRVKILINGKEGAEFEDKEVNFREAFEAKKAI